VLFFWMILCNSWSPQRKPLVTFFSFQYKLGNKPFSKKKLCYASLRIPFGVTFCLVDPSQPTVLAP
jgi:hypothetical protein